MSLIAAGVGLAGNLIGAFGAGKRRRAAKRRADAAQRKFDQLEANRQDIINPYAGAASQLSNPFANLPVATQAAEMQAQQTDLSLASTLDTLRATGAGAGGATALAQAALQGKQGVAASIEQQEARNQQLRAQGEQALQQQLFDADVRGKSFVFGQQEKREQTGLDRAQQQLTNAQLQEEQARQEQQGFLGSALGNVAGLAAGGLFGGGAGAGATSLAGQASQALNVVGNAGDTLKNLNLNVTQGNQFMNTNFGG